MAKGSYNISVSGDSNLEEEGKNNNENQECMNSCLSSTFLRSLSLQDQPRSSRVPTNKEQRESRYRALVSTSLQKIPSYASPPSEARSESGTNRTFQPAGIDAETAVTTQPSIYNATSSAAHQQIGRNQLSEPDNWLEDTYRRFSVESEQLLEKTVDILRTVDADISESLANLTNPESIALEPVMENYKNKGRNNIGCSTGVEFDLSTESSSHPIYENWLPFIKQKQNDAQAQSTPRRPKNLKAHSPQQRPKNTQAKSTRQSLKVLQTQSSQQSLKNAKIHSTQQSPRNLPTHSSELSPKNLQAHSLQPKCLSLTELESMALDSVMENCRNKDRSDSDCSNGAEFDLFKESSSHPIYENWQPFIQQKLKDVQAQSTPRKPENLQTLSTQKSSKNTQVQSSQQPPKNLPTKSAPKSPKNSKAYSVQQNSMNAKTHFVDKSSKNFPTVSAQQSPKNLKDHFVIENSKTLQAQSSQQIPKNGKTRSVQQKPKYLQTNSVQLSPKNLPTNSAQQSRKNLKGLSVLQNFKNLQAESSEQSPKNAKTRSVQQIPKNLPTTSVQPSLESLKAHPVQQSQKNLQAQSSNQSLKNLLFPSVQETLKNFESLSTNSGKMQSLAKPDSDDVRSVEQSPRNWLPSPKSGSSRADDTTKVKYLMEFDLPSDHEQFVKIIGALQNRCLEYREMIQDIAVSALEEFLNFSERSISRMRHLRKQFLSQKRNFRDFKELCSKSVVPCRDSLPINEQVTEMIQSFFLQLLQEENETFMARLEFGLKMGEVYAKMLKLQTESKKIITTLEKEILYLKKTSVGFKV